MAPPAAGTAARPQHCVVVGLRGDDLLLNLRQQLPPVGQCQTELGDIDKTIGPNQLHDVDAQGLTVDPSSNQPQNPPHPRSPSRQYTQPIVPLMSSIPQSLDSPAALRS
jgi:hypothetical protein